MRRSSFIPSIRGKNRRGSENARRIARAKRAVENQATQRTRGEREKEREREREEREREKPKKRPRSRRKTTTKTTTTTGRKSPRRSIKKATCTKEIRRTSPRKKAGLDPLINDNRREILLYVEKRVVNSRRSV